jgi:excisionase family DNA binding protein
MKTLALDDLMTTAQAAEYLRVTDVTLWRWRKSGKLKAVKASGKLLFPKSTLKQFLKAHTEA